MPGVTHEFRFPIRRVYKRRPHVDEFNRLKFIGKSIQQRIETFYLGIAIYCQGDIDQTGDNSGYKNLSTRVKNFDFLYHGANISVTTIRVNGGWQIIGTNME